MRIKLKEINISNFKGCKEQKIGFSDKTKIDGANATGKTTVIDAFMWLLFDKDSTGASKFQIRPLNKDGKQIDFVEISVEATLDVDGKAVVLKKVQKQNWVKDRSTQEQRFKGNVNEFEINGYPKSEKDYKDYISELVEEELFKMITNPQTFTALPWKKQREILMRLCDDASDIELAQSEDKYSNLIPELEQATTDDIHKKYTKALNAWKKKQVELPARIDEISKQLVDIDTAELELQANCIKEQIGEIEAQEDDENSQVKEYDKITSEIVRVKGEIRDIYDKANNELANERKAIQSSINDAQIGFNDARQQIKMNNLDIQRAESAIERNEAEKIRLQNMWKECKVENYPDYEPLPTISEDELVCPTCGQDLPEEVKARKIADAEEREKQHLNEWEKGKETFLKEKEETLEQITVLGNNVVEAIKKDKEEIDQLKSTLEENKAASIRYNKEFSDLNEKLRALPESPDLSENQVYDSLQIELSKLEESLKNTDTGMNYRSQLKEKISGLQADLIDVEKKIASADNSAIEERIEELREEQREVAQNIADQEQMIYLLEEFIRMKLDKISDSINSKFDTVSWKLFTTQINGAIKETCECTVNGVPYTSLNSGHKIVAGLDIIKSLSRLYEVSAPIFVDNAESINDFNIPEMDCQMVLLAVSDDERLKVEAA